MISQPGRDPASPSPEIALVKETAQRIKENVGAVIVGKGEVIDLVMAALLSQGHILIEDVPGIGKTTLAKAVARSLGCTFKRIQFTPDLMPSDVTGINFFNQKRGEFEFRPGPIMAQIVLGDEINRATPRTQAALLEAMQEHQVTVDGVTMPLPAPFLVMATQNPIELEGTFPLPEAELDRFIIRIKLGYPTEKEERDIILRFEKDDPLEHLEAVLTAEELIKMQEAVQMVRCDEALLDYVVKVSQATRLHPAVELGASPRATLSLYKTARARAALHSRDYIIPDDVKAMAPFVLTHRIILSSPTRLRGRTGEAVITEVLQSVPVPV